MKKFILFLSLLAYAYSSEISPMCVKVFNDNFGNDYTSFVKSINVEKCNNFFRTNGEKLIIKNNEVTSFYIGNSFSYKILSENKEEILMNFYNNIFLFEKKGIFLILKKSIFFPCFKKISLKKSIQGVLYDLIGYKDEDGMCTNKSINLHLWSKT